MRPPTSRTIVALAGIVALASGCGASGEPASAVPGSSGIAGDVTVFAAASLTDAFTDLGEAFTTAHPAVEVTFNFAASSALVTQIGQGAPADVFASADTDSMARLTDIGGTGTAPTVFTTNRVQIIVGRGNPEGITGLADLAADGLIVVVCAPEVPCGRYARQILDDAGVDVAFASLEENARAVVSKVTLGEADAGIVYATDVLAAGGAADGVDIPAAANMRAEYPIAVTAEAPNPQAARAFVDFVLSAEGQEILALAGFASP